MKNLAVFVLYVLGFLCGYGAGFTRGADMVRTVVVPARWIRWTPDRPHLVPTDPDDPRRGAWTPGDTLGERDADGRRRGPIVFSFMASCAEMDSALAAERLAVRRLVSMLFQVGAPDRMLQEAEGYRHAMRPSAVTTVDSCRFGRNLFPTRQDTTQSFDLAPLIRGPLYDIRPMGPITSWWNDSGRIRIWMEAGDDTLEDRRPWQSDPWRIPHTLQDELDSMEPDDRAFFQWMLRDLDSLLHPHPDSLTWQKIRAKSTAI